MAACVYSVERRPHTFMAERKLPARAAILAAGCIMFLFTGTIYAWSILSSPFPVEFGWTSAQLGLNFTIVMSCFCIGGLAGSFVTRRLSARVTVLIGAVMCFLGYFLCSRITAQSLWLLYISYGGLIGLGVGFSYNAVLGTVVGWFPDKKGFASGVLLMGFGCSTLIMGNLADRLFNSAMGWRTTYLLLGAATLVVLLIGSRWVVPNPHMAAPAGSAAATARREYTTGQMVKTAAFWLLFFIIVCSNLIGTGVIGHSRYIAVEAGVATGITALVVGLQSVCNGLGRLAFGTLFDNSGGGRPAAHRLLLWRHAHYDLHRHGRLLRYPKLRHQFQHRQYEYAARFLWCYHCRRHPDRLRYLCYGVPGVPRRHCRGHSAGSRLPWGRQKTIIFPLVPLFSVKGGTFCLIILQNSQINSIPIVYIVIIDKH